MGKDPRLLQKGTQAARLWVARLACFTTIEKEQQLRDLEIMLMSAMIEVIAKCDRRVLDGFKDI